MKRVLSIADPIVLTSFSAVISEMNGWGFELFEWRFWATYGMLVAYGMLNFFLGRESKRATAPQNATRRAGDENVRCGKE